MHVFCCQRETDRQTDRQTNRIFILITLHSKGSQQIYKKSRLFIFVLNLFVFVGGFTTHSNHLRIMRRPHRIIFYSGTYRSEVSEDMLPGDVIKRPHRFHQINLNINNMESYVLVYQSWYLDVSVKSAKSHSNTVCREYRYVQYVCYSIDIDRYGKNTYTMQLKVSSKKVL